MSRRYPTPGIKAIFRTVSRRTGRKYSLYCVTLDTLARIYWQALCKKFRIWSVSVTHFSEVDSSIRPMSEVSCPISADDSNETSISYWLSFSFSIGCRQRTDCQSMESVRKVSFVVFSRSRFRSSKSIRRSNVRNGVFLPSQRRSKHPEYDRFYRERKRARERERKTHLAYFRIPF